MPAKKDTPKFQSLLDVVKQFPTEKHCWEYLIQVRWGGEPSCPFCGNAGKIYRINEGKTLKCAECRKQFTVRVGTIFEDSALPLQKWFMAMYLVTAHKKGISSCQLAKDIDVTQKTAWFLLHRIRYALERGSLEKFEGTTEADETYVGGKRKGKRGRGAAGKTPVFGLAERWSGEVRTQPVNGVDGKTLKRILRENVEPGTRVMTDEWTAYNGLGSEYQHETVNHGTKEFARGATHTNTMENFWSLLKRGIFGIYHQVSPEHLHRYCSEFEFRHNTREDTDVERFGLAMRKIGGKRLLYRELIK